MWLAGEVPTLAMFPLGSVLLPYMPLRLRVFEQRYLIMLSDLLKTGVAEFGVVLIERGQEVGGGEQRFAYGTVAEITSMGTSEGFLGLVGGGAGTVRGRSSGCPRNPHPRAEVTPAARARLGSELWGPAGRGRAAGPAAPWPLASEFRENVWPADIELSDDPLRACWQLAGIAPLGPLDQLELLRSRSIARSAWPP